MRLFCVAGGRDKQHAVRVFCRVARSLGRSVGGRSVVGRSVGRSCSFQAKKKVLFNNATLKINHGQRYGFLGPNGQGKTTLLKMIAAKELRIPRAVDFLMVDQEIVADDTPVRVLSEHPGPDHQHSPPPATSTLNDAANCACWPSLTAFS